MSTNRYEVALADGRLRYVKSMDGPIGIDVAARVAVRNNYGSEVVGVRSASPDILDYDAELIRRAEEACENLIAVVAETMHDDVSEDTRQAIANIVEQFCAKVDEL